MDRDCVWKSKCLISLKKNVEIAFECLKILGCFACNRFLLLRERQMYTKWSHLCSGWYACMLPYHKYEMSSYRKYGGGKFQGPRFHVTDKRIFKVPRPCCSHRPLVLKIDLYYILYIIYHILYLTSYILYLISYIL